MQMSSSGSGSESDSGHWTLDFGPSTLASGQKGKGPKARKPNKKH